MKTVVHTDDSRPAVSPSAVDSPVAKKAAGAHAGNHVYRVGGLRIPVRNSVRGPKSRSAGRVKDLLRRRAAPVPMHSDPTVFEPPIRKPSSPRGSHASHDFSPQRDLQLGRGRFENDDDVEALDDDE